jgi:apolipoprotein D and lipocalin family protein
MMKKILSGAACLALFGCAGIPDGVSAVDRFEVNRYLGTWYEIARLDHRFERGLTNVSATYSLRDGGGLTVVNRGYDVHGEKWKEARGRAYFVGSQDVGMLKVTFFWPFYGGYNIVELDTEEYRYALVCGPNRDYLWILARDKNLEAAIYKKMVARAGELGFAVDQLIEVKHDML